MTSATRAPRSFWAVALISLFWNAFGCFDYTMTKLDPAGYLGGSGLSQQAIEYMASMPGWLTVFWALGVWGSLCGSVLLLLRSRHSLIAFMISLLGLAVNQGYQFSTGLPAEMKTAQMTGMTVLIWAGLLFFLWYARHASTKGYLR